jgi:MFS superfamily sulfate permease-like transporter
MSNKSIVIFLVSYFLGVSVGIWVGVSWADARYAQDQPRLEQQFDKAYMQNGE